MTTKPRTPMTDYLRREWPESRYCPDSGWPDERGRVCVTGALNRDGKVFGAARKRLKKRGVPDELLRRWSARIWHWNNRHGHQAAILAIEHLERTGVVPKCPGGRDDRHEQFFRLGLCRRSELLPSDKLIPKPEREWIIPGYGHTTKGKQPHER